MLFRSGMMGFDKAQLSAYRDAVAAASGMALESVLHTLLKDHGRMNPPDLARVPRPFDKNHERGELLRRKSLTVWHDFDDPSCVERPDLLDLCSKQFATYQGLADWLGTHIPPTA